MMAHHTGQSVDKVTEDTERDNFMDADESKSYGLIDEVWTKGHRTITLDRVVLILSSSL